MTYITMENENKTGNRSLVMTNLQRRILQLYSQGNTVSEISSILQMDEIKIEILCQILLRKFEFSDMKHLSVMASENGLIGKY